jgi:maltose alpha-D-glucosyltransferase / alpha-amylase
VHPLIDQGVWDYRHVNVEAQRRDPGSLLNWTARMIRLRKECPEIGWGTYQILSTGNPSVLAIRYDWRGNSVLVVHNFDQKPHQARIKPQVEMGHTLTNLLKEEESHANDSGTHRIPLEAFGYRWFRVGGLNYAIKRQKK